MQQAPDDDEAHSIVIFLTCWLFWAMPSLKGISMFYAKKIQRREEVEDPEYLVFWCKFKLCILVHAYERLEVTANETLEEINNPCIHA
jgi:hypothetical protein